VPRVTKPVGDRLPDEVLGAFDGRDLERKIGSAYVLISLDPDGSPRPCMLSAGEVLAPDDRHLRVALWAGTHTVRNLAAGKPVLFCFVASGTVLYVRGLPRDLGPSEATKLARFEIDVTSVESDVHVGMPVTSTITFSVGSADPAEVAETWREQLDALREA
jgi:hypothetical protein